MKTCADVVTLAGVLGCEPETLQVTLDSIHANSVPADGRQFKRALQPPYFAVKVTVAPATIEEADRASLRSAGFSDRDIWDISAVTAFFNMSNRMASAVDMRPNPEYHAQAR